MTRNYLALTAVLAALLGCGSGALSPEGTPTSTTDPLASDPDEAAGIKEDAQCVHRGKTCKSGGHGCCSGFCNQTGYGYGPGTCTAPQPDLSYCMNDSWCKNKNCVQNLCGAAVTTCGAIDHSCKVDGDCCSGTFCRNDTYAPWTCVAPTTNGSFCERDNQCQSGICQDYNCVAKSCVAVGTSCKQDNDCCSGNFCDNTGGYGSFACTAPRPLGGYCHSDAQCQSGTCEDYACIAASCTQASSVCKQDSDCCAGLYCQTGGYISSYCQATHAIGEYCVVGSQCTSGHCVSYQCAL